MNYLKVLTWILWMTYTLLILLQIVYSKLTSININKAIIYLILFSKFLLVISKLFLFLKSIKLKPSRVSAIIRIIYMCSISPSIPASSNFSKIK